MYSGSGGGQKSTAGSAGLRTGAHDGTQDVWLFDSARLPPKRASEATQSGDVGGRDRRDSGRRQDQTSQTGAHRPADLQTFASGAPVPRWLHDREGLSARRDAEQSEDVHSATRAPGTAQADFGEAPVIVGGERTEGPLLRDRPAILELLFRYGAAVCITIDNKIVVNSTAYMSFNEALLAN